MKTGTFTPEAVALALPRAKTAMAHRLTAGVAVVVAAASLAGLWAQDLYTDSTAVEAMFRGYDLVTLVIVAPLLLLTLLPAVRGRVPAELLRMSMLAYCAYNYAYYLFGAELNSALLAHIAIFAGSLYALVASMATLDVAALAAHFHRHTRARAVAVILLVLGASLAVLQASGLAAFALTGTAPAEPSQLVVSASFTRLGAVLDLSLLAPAYLLAGFWLWRRRPWGFLLAAVTLLAGVTHQISYIAGMLSQIAADIPEAGFDPFEPIIIGVYVLGSALLLGGLRGGTSGGIVELRGIEPLASSMRPRRSTN